MDETTRTIYVINSITNSVLVFLYCFYVISYFFFIQTTIPFLPVFSSMKLLMRYSLGSVAIGSLIVSFVESTRFILEAIRRRLKVADIMPESWIKRMMFYTSRFCLKGIELTIKSVNRNAYIMVSKNSPNYLFVEMQDGCVLRVG